MSKKVKRNCDFFYKNIDLKNDKIYYKFMNEYKLQMSVSDRLSLLELLPKKDNIRTLMVLKSIESKLQLTDEEKLTIGFEIIPTGNRVGIRWGRKKGVSYHICPQCRKKYQHNKDKTIDKSDFEILVFGENENIKDDIEKEITFSISEITVLKEIIQKKDNNKDIDKNALNICWKIKEIILQS